MKQAKNRRYPWLKLSLAVGAALALTLLVNSINQYRYVSGRVITHHLQQEARKQIVALEQRVRRSESVDLARMVEETRKENEGKLAWIRVLNADDAVIAASGEASGAPLSGEKIRSRLSNRETITEVRETVNGPVLVTVAAFRVMQGPPPAPGRRRPHLMEMALYMDSADAIFWPLRRNLIINCSAALALLGALLVMSLRFPVYVRGKQLEQQMALARSVQQDLMPAAGNAGPHVEAAAECEPAWQVGGDFYDIFPAGGSNVAMALGDVSGKGLPAALLMRLIHGGVRSSAWHQSPAQHEESSRQLNQLLLTQSSQAQFASMFWCYYEPRIELLRYVNAGHCPPLLLQAGETRIERLNGGGPVLGLLKDAGYRQEAVPFSPGDLLVLYSDGIVEATNGDGEEFGEERLCAALLRLRAGSAEEIRAGLLGELKAFLGGEQPEDDRTLMIVRAQSVPAEDVDEALANLLEGMSAVHG